MAENDPMQLQFATEEVSAPPQRKHAPRRSDEERDRIREAKKARRHAPNINSAPAIHISGQDTLAPPDAPPCKHFRRTLGHCMFGDQCKFQHTSFETHRQQAFQDRPVKLDPTSGKRKRSRPRNKGRAGEFRRWLIDTFGLPFLQSGSGVLDVAGGKGELSFELLNLNCCPATIVDPRGFIDYSRFQKKLLCGFYHRNELLTAASDLVEPPSGPEAIGTPGHVKLFWGPALWEGLQLGLDGAGLPQCLPDDYDAEYRALRGAEPVELGLDERRAQLVDRFATARAYTWSCKGLHLAAGGQDDAVEEMEEEWSYEGLRQLLQECSCVVGMHPDQAAEGIVDFALHTGKPFALVPCCVYSKTYPRKKTPMGTPVSNHQDLIAHLQAKHPAIRRAQLPFEGKNTVLYWHPSF